jgi:hypothetical protein
VPEFHVSTKFQCREFPCAQNSNTPSAGARIGATSENRLRFTQMRKPPKQAERTCFERHGKNILFFCDGRHTCDPHHGVGLILRKTSLFDGIFKKGPYPLFILMPSPLPLQLEQEFGGAAQSRREDLPRSSWERNPPAWDDPDPRAIGVQSPGPRTLGAHSPGPSTSGVHSPGLTTVGAHSPGPRISGAHEPGPRTTGAH